MSDLFKKYPARLLNGRKVEWLGEVPPEALTGQPFSVIVEIDTDQFLLNKKADEAEILDTKNSIADAK